MRCLKITCEDEDSDDDDMVDNYRYLCSMFEICVHMVENYRYRYSMFEICCKTQASLSCGFQSYQSLNLERGAVHEIVPTSRLRFDVNLISNLHFYPLLLAHFDNLA